MKKLKVISEALKFYEKPAVDSSAIVSEPAPVQDRFMTPASITEKTLAIIMGGGAGSRLFPLTKER